MTLRKKCPNELCKSTKYIVKGRFFYENGRCTKCGSSWGKMMGKPYEAHHMSDEVWERLNKK